MFYFYTSWPEGYTQIESFKDFQVGPLAGMT